MTSSPRIPSRIAAVLAAAAIVVSVALAACRPAVPPVPEEAVQPDFKVEPVAKRMMPVAKRNAALPKGLPIEVPVIDGSVVGTSAELGTKTWMYTVDTTGPVAAVSDWYDRAYRGAQWVSDPETQTAGEARILFKKHGARTRLTVEAVKGERVRVRASIALGQIPTGTY